jgi:hypothetical protein
LPFPRADAANRLVLLVFFVGKIDPIAPSHLAKVTMAEATEMHETVTINTPWYGMCRYDEGRAAPPADDPTFDLVLDASGTPYRIHFTSRQLGEVTASNGRHVAITTEARPDAQLHLVSITRIG